MPILATCLWITLAYISLIELIGSYNSLVKPFYFIRYIY
jgi:hypothetical protein